MQEILLTAPAGLDSNITSLIKGSIDAAETIQLCAQHQKGIVDDILTISKLDSNLLVISPVPIQPVKIVQQCKLSLLLVFSGGRKGVEVLVILTLFFPIQSCYAL